MPLGKCHKWSRTWHSPIHLSLSQRQVKDQLEAIPLEKPLWETAKYNLEPNAHQRGRGFVYPYGWLMLLNSRNGGNVIKQLLLALSFSRPVTSSQLFAGPMDCSTPGLPVPHHLPKFAQVHVQSNYTPIEKTNNTHREKYLLRDYYKEMTTYSSILAWRIPWTEESGRLQSMGSHELNTT